MLISQDQNCIVPKTSLMDLFCVTKKSVIGAKQKILKSVFDVCFSILCVTSLSCFRKGVVTFRALYFPFSLCVICDLFESNMMGVKARWRFIRFFSSFLLGSGVGISRGAVWLFLEAEQWTSLCLPEDDDWEGFIHFNFLIFFGGHLQWKLCEAHFWKWFFPGRGRWTYSKSEKWFGWRAQTTEGEGSLPPRWYTLPWPVCPR